MKLIHSICCILSLSVVAVACSHEHSAHDDSPQTYVHTSADTIDVPEYDEGICLLENWVVTSAVDSASVAEFGMDRCFAAQPLNDSIFNLINGKSYHESSPVKPSDLRYLKLLHYDAEGCIRLGEMIVNKAIADDVVDIFRNLYHRHYPIERMILVDNYDADDETSMAANNSSCYNCRNIQGSSHLSLHASGLAIDINPLYNPYVKKSGDKIIKVLPEAGYQYADRTDSKYILKYDDPCYREFLAHGFSWGGSWKRAVKDYQHFQKQSRR